MGQAEEFELYHNCESLCSKKARLGFLEKRQPFGSHHIQLCDISPDCQNLSSDYLKVNPKGIVPTLMHNGQPVYDAHRIVKHLDEQRPKQGEALWPEDARRQELAQEWFDFGMLNDAAPLSTTFGNALPVLTLPIIAKLLQRQDRAALQANMVRHPLKQRANLFLSLHSRGAQALSPDRALPPQAIEQTLDSLGIGLLRANANLAEFGGPWLLGDFSLADITMTAAFHRLQDVRLDALLQDKAVPRLADYWQRLQQRPSYAEGVLSWHDPGWRSAIDEVFGDAPSPLLERARERLRQ